MDNIFEIIENYIKFLSDEGKIEFRNKILDILYKYSKFKHNPVDNVKWVKIEKVEANDYNPNRVASAQLRLLYISIINDGITQPIVCYYDKENDKYIIVDGFHRYFLLKTNEELKKLNNGYIPIVVIDKSLAERMASTVRHNRARGKHIITGMSNLVYKMLMEGVSDDKIKYELGLTDDELVRLKHITGYSKLFENIKEYSKSWVSKKQLMEKQKFIDKQNKHI
ncbi:MAG: ParB/RepB/Spo0J family partition protein [Thermoplasmata archaeon]